jgi:hypothetical protein
VGQTGSTGSASGPREKQSRLTEPLRTDVRLRRRSSHCSPAAVSREFHCHYVPDASDVEYSRAVTLSVRMTYTLGFGSPADSPQKIYFAPI